MANILGVTKKTIEKWEQGVNNINGSSAVLLKLLEANPELINQLYSVKYGVEGKPEEDNYKVIASKTITAVSRTCVEQAIKWPVVAIF